MKSQLLEFVEIAAKALRFAEKGPMRGRRESKWPRFGNAYKPAFTYQVSHNGEDILT